MGVFLNIQKEKIYLSVLYILIFIVIRLAIHIISFTSSAGTYNEISYIYDLMWVDVWGLSFLLTLTYMWLIPLKQASKLFITLCLFSLFGFISIFLFLNNTPFGINGFYGDQSFRISNILKLMNFFPPMDFYYKDLPTFYPPMSFYFQALLGKVFDLKAYETIKISLALFFLIGPFLLHKAWKPIVGYQKSIFISLFVFLISNAGYAYLLFNPYEFLGNSFFIPWFIYFIELKNNKNSFKKNMLYGGFFGAIIFTTYPFPFFIGGVYLVIKSIYYLLSKNSIKSGVIIQNWLVCITAALLSSWYWLPAYISILQFGGKPAKQEWFHIGRTGIMFDFMKFDWFGVILITSILYIIYKFQSKMNQSLIMLFGLSIVIYIIGTFLGAIDYPINVLKVNTLLVVLGGVFTGILIAQTVRVRNLKLRKMFFILFIFIIALFVKDYNAVARNSQVKKARTAKIPDFGINTKLAKEIKGKIFLTGYDKLSVFYPVYYFSTANQHYSHPASEYLKRYTFINMLQYCNDSYLLFIAMKYNRFNAIDYFMPRTKDGNYVISYTISSYPNKFTSYEVKFNKNFIDSYSLFIKKNKNNLFELKNNTVSVPAINKLNNLKNLKDSTQQLYVANFIYQNLSPTGQQYLNEYFSTNLRKNKFDNKANKAVNFDNKIQLTSLYMLSNTDSVIVYFDFMVKDFMQKDYKNYFHIKSKNKNYNYDFYPPIKTSKAKPGYVFHVTRTFPRLGDTLAISGGFFNKELILGEPYYETFILSN